MRQCMKGHWSVCWFGHLSTVCRCTPVTCSMSCMPELQTNNRSTSDLTECLNVNWFLSLKNAQENIQDWRQEYNHFRPHSSLSDKTLEEWVEYNIVEP